MVTLVERLPTPDEFRAVAESVGWGDHFDWPTIPAALAGSLAAVVAVEDDRVVGVARVVGDGVRYFYLQDVMVAPDSADAGIATALTSRLVDWIERSSAPQAFIGLFASPDAEGVYDELGFASGGDMTGMHRVLG